MTTKKNNGNIYSLTDGLEVFKGWTMGEGGKLYLFYYTTINNLTSGLMVTYKSAFTSIYQKNVYSQNHGIGLLDFICQRKSA